jgi:hypothetical protein
MSAAGVLFSHRLRRHATPLLITGLVAIWGCSSSSGGSASPMKGGGSGASSGGGSGNPSGGASGGGSGGMASGSSSAGSSGAGSSGASSSGVGSGGNTDGGGAGDSDGGIPHDAGTDGSSRSTTCSNPTHVLPLNPANAQDGITLGAFYVDTDTWNAASYMVTQTMYVCDYNNWYVVANMNNNTHDGAVKTYPDVHKDFTSAPLISSYRTISTTFAHTAPHVGIYEFAYDIWVNGVASSGSTEVMIWTDNFNQVPSGSVLETVTLDGVSYNVYKSGSYIAFVVVNNVTSGTLNLLSFFNHIISKGWIPPSSTLGAVDYGVELVSTNGADATFAVNGFSLTTN